MFICKECLNDDPIYMPQSRGPCEVCGKTRVCYDIHHSQLPSSKPEQKGDIMSEKHTPGKLKIEGAAINNESGSVVAICCSNKANAERLVKCWNLCEDRTTDDLEDCVVVTKYD